MVPPRDILDYVVAELRVGALAPADVLSHLRDAWVWDETSANQLRADIREAYDGGRLTDAEAGDLGRGIDTWLAAMSGDDPTESIDDPSIIAMHLTRESHEGPSLELRPGVILQDRYVLGDAIARGGQSIVFRAHVMHDGDGTDAGMGVAIKVLKDTHPSAAAIARLKREFRQTQLLQHPGVTQMFDLGCDRGTWFIAMELLEGMSLRTRLNRVATQPLGRAEALQIVADCGAVLTRAHQLGFAHGDVKPGNVFLQEKGGTKVLDFGAAYDIQPAPPARAHEAGFTSTILTRVYASPEVLDGLAVEPRDDVFSLACVAYEMLAGRHPFSRVAANEARARDMDVTPVAGLTPRQNAALASALAWSRTRRPASIERWLEMLLDASPGVPAKGRRKSTTASAALATWLPWRWIAAVGTVAVLLLVVTWWTSRPSEEGIAAQAVVADPGSDAAQLQRESPALAVPTAGDPSRTLESNLAPAAAPAQMPTDAAGAPASVARPARSSTANAVRIEADTPSIRISEGAAAAVVVLRRSGNPAVPVTVTWQLQDGSAHEGEDFATSADRSARFAAGQTTRAIYVPLLNDTVAEPEEFFSLIFQSPAAAIDAAGRVTITIFDDD